MTAAAITGISRRFFFGFVVSVSADGSVVTAETEVVASEAVTAEVSFAAPAGFFVEVTVVFAVVFVVVTVVAAVTEVVVCVSLLLSLSSEELSSSGAFLSPSSS